MRATALLLLCALLSVGQAGPDGLRGASGKNVTSSQDAFVTHSDVEEDGRLGMMTKDKFNNFTRQLGEKGEQITGSVDVITSTIEMYREPSWPALGANVESIGSLVAVAVPAPAGLIAGSFMGLAGKLMGIFGGGSSGPSNSDIMDAISKGFRDMGVKLDELEGQLKAVQKTLDKLVIKTSQIYMDSVLNAGDINKFIARVAALSRLLNSASVDPTLMGDYTEYLHDLALEARDMQGDSGYLGKDKLDAMLSELEHMSDTRGDSPQDYRIVTDKVALYNWFYQARSFLFSVLTQSSVIKHGKVNVAIVDYLNNFADDVAGYDAVLKNHNLGSTVSFTDAHASVCSETAGSVMRAQGLSLNDFMNPYIYITRGDCSHPVGFEGPTWDSALPESFTDGSLPGLQHYGSNGTLDMLVDVDEQACDQSLFWNGRSKTDVNALDERDYTSSNLQFQWLGRCPAGVEPFVQRDDVHQAPSCGCKVSGSDILAIEGVELGNPLQSGARMMKNSEGKCLEAVQGNEKGGKIEFSQCDSSNRNQQWDYDSSTLLIKLGYPKQICSEGAHRVTTNCFSQDYCLDANDRNKNLRAPHMWPCNSGNKNQQWRLQDGRIRNKYGICLVGLEFLSSGGSLSMARSTPFMFPCSSGSHDNFITTLYTKLFKKTARVVREWKTLARYSRVQPSFVMCKNSCFGSSTDQARQTTLHSACLGKAKESTPSSTEGTLGGQLGNGAYTIQRKVNMQYLDAHEDSGNDYSAVTRVGQDNDSQKWVITQVVVLGWACSGSECVPNAITHVVDGEYTIQQKVNMQYLDAYEDSGNDYSAVTRVGQDNDSQKWVITQLGNGEYTIQQKVNMQYLDAYEDSANDYSAITRVGQDNDSQKWVITRVGNEETSGFMDICDSIKAQDAASIPVSKCACRSTYCVAESSQAFGSLCSSMCDALPGTSECA